MIDAHSTRISSDGTGDFMFSGPIEEIAKLLGKLHTAFFLDSSLKDLLSKTQIVEQKGILEEVAMTFRSKSTSA